MRHHDHAPRHPADRRRGRTDDRDLGWDLARDLGLGPGFGGRPRGRRRGGRGGDVRAAALLLLAEEPRHGYQLIQEIGDRSQGAWTPSPGSVYPALQQLEDEGLVVFDRVDGRKTATLTDAGRAYVEEHAERLGTPWEDTGRDPSGQDVRELARALKGFISAWKQVAATATPAQRERATAVVEEARRSLYRILADDDS